MSKPTVDDMAKLHIIYQSLLKLIGLKPEAICLAVFMLSNSFDIDMENITKTEAWIAKNMERLIEHNDVAEADAFVNKLYER